MFYHSRATIKKINDKTISVPILWNKNTLFTSSQRKGGTPYKFNLDCYNNFIGDITDDLEHGIVNTFCQK
jgi:hypothetical protein